MDSKQGWYGYFYKLDYVINVLKSFPKARRGETKIDELYVTLVVAGFLQWQEGSEHRIGFPSLEGRDDLTLRSLLNGDATIDDDDFDTVMIDTRKPDEPFRLQIKRYTKRQEPSTDDFFQFLCSKVKRYGCSPKLNLVFHVLENMKFDLRRLALLLRSQNFQVASVVILAESKSDSVPFLFSVHPKFTGEIWYPPNTSPTTPPQNPPPHPCL